MGGGSFIPLFTTFARSVKVASFPISLALRTLASAEGTHEGHFDRRPAKSIASSLLVVFKPKHISPWNGPILPDKLSDSCSWNRARLACYFAAGFKQYHRGYGLDFELLRQAREFFSVDFNYEPQP